MTVFPSSIRFPARPLHAERVFCCSRVSRVGRALLAALLMAFVVLSPVAAQTATPAPATGLESGAAWLQAQAGADGGYIGFSGEPDTGTTVNVLLALAALKQAGIPVDLQPATNFLLAGDHALVYAQTSAGDAALLVLAAVAVGLDPRNVAGVDPLSLATHALDRNTKLYGGGVYDHALVILAMVAAGDEVPKAAISALADYQLKDGSWAFDGSTTDGAGDTNTTAIAIQALVAAGFKGGRDIEQALGYLKSVQLDDGGFPFQPGQGAAADGNSTGLVVQALFAAGEDPRGGDWNGAYAALQSFQNPSGAFHYLAAQPDDNLFATVQALPALAGIAFPIIPAALATPIAA